MCRVACFQLAGYWWRKANHVWHTQRQHCTASTILVIWLSWYRCKNGSQFLNKKMHFHISSCDDCAQCALRKCEWKNLRKMWMEKKRKERLTDIIIKPNKRYITWQRHALKKMNNTRKVKHAKLKFSVIVSIGDVP